MKLDRGGEGTVITLNILDRCQSCPEFEPETRKEFLYGDGVEETGDIQIACANRRLCDGILKYLEKCKESQSEVTKKDERNQGIA